MRKSVESLGVLPRNPVVQAFRNWLAGLDAVSRTLFAGQPSGGRPRASRQAEGAPRS